MPRLYLWQINDITSVGPDAFPNTGDGNGGAVGVSSFVIDAGATTHAIEVTDDDGLLENNDGSLQDIATAVVFDGSSFSPGDNIQVEYSYIVRPTGSSDPADNLTVHAIRMDNTLHGVASDAPLVPGVSYDVLSISSNSPVVAYSNLVACFGPGTLIDTPDGPRRVEALRHGDLVSTCDHGPQPVRWIRNSHQSPDRSRKDNRPVRIKAGALGRGIPARDLIVSPQHRILCRWRRPDAGPVRPRSARSRQGVDGAAGHSHAAGARPGSGGFTSRATGTRSSCPNGCRSESLLLGPDRPERPDPGRPTGFDRSFRPRAGARWRARWPRLRATYLTVGSVRRRIARHFEISKGSTRPAAPRTGIAHA